MRPIVAVAQDPSTRGKVARGRNFTAKYKQPPSLRIAPTFRRKQQYTLSRSQLVHCMTAQSSSSTTDTTLLPPTMPRPQGKLPVCFRGCAKSVRMRAHEGLHLGTVLLYPGLANVCLPLGILRVVRPPIHPRVRPAENGGKFFVLCFQPLTFPCALCTQGTRAYTVKQWRPLTRGRREIGIGELGPWNPVRNPGTFPPLG